MTTVILKTQEAALAAIIDTVDEARSKALDAGLLSVETELRRVRAFAEQTRAKVRVTLAELGEDVSS